MDVTPTSDQLNVTATPTHSDVNTSSSQTAASFAQALGGAVNVAGQLAGAAAGASGFGLGPLGGIAANIGGLNSPIDGNAGSNTTDLSFAQLLQLQQQIQKESEQFNAMTNISKTEYETFMAAIRNLKA
jgi:hypothetical protein